MELAEIAGLILFLLALTFGYLAWTARNIWRDQRATRIFVLIAILCTVSVMVLAIIM